MTDLRLMRERAALFVVDIQDRLVPTMQPDVMARVIKNTAILIESAARLGVPIVVSQQYPKGLGSTAPEIEAALSAALATGLKVHRFDKMEFSAAAAPAFADLPDELRVPTAPEPATGLAAQLAHAGKTLGAMLRGNRRDQWIVCGMETHVCVYQTVRDLTSTSRVFVVADAVCSRADANWKIGLDLCRSAGATITSTEVVVFDLLHKAGSDEFKALSKLIR
jgi:nicotinamidase-related amidase